MTSPPPLQVTGAKVLVVDDQPLNRDVLSRRVKREGLDVETAEDGRQALEMLESGTFDLVLLDVHMPEMDGMELLEIMKGDQTLAHIPVIMISAVDELDTVVRCLELGADDYLPKAFKPVILRARMRAALDRKRLRDAERRYAEALDRELNMGRRIQRDFLPASLPEADGVELSAALESARQVSGDFYDAFVLSEHEAIFFAVGDVCDKGVGAALYMALFRSLMRASADPNLGGSVHMPGARRSAAFRALESESLGSLLTRVASFTNDYIAQIHGHTNMFATVFFGTIMPDTGAVEFVNAGHEPSLHVRKDGQLVELCPTGPALGLMPDATFTVGECILEPGDMLLALTDGTIEARDTTGEAFGEERLRSAIAESAVSAHKLVQIVMESLHAFTGGAEPHDDVTLLVVTRTG
jgi:serine phosphatase RsbU (regulator of sigma subunit)